MIRFALSPLSGWKRIWRVLAVILTVWGTVPACAQEASVVEAPAGSVRGVQSGETRVFRGIPYAQPPVGELRWRAPQPLPRWSGIRDATQFGAACVQPALPAGFEIQGPISEDCLFLNIWVPPNAQDVPVMVWIHGGSLVNGTGRDTLYDGTHFADEGVIVVSINYRLGALGYLSHPDLSAEAEDNISGNYGLLDQIQALRWVQNNIAAFGGDPGNVTIAGESAGGLSVVCLMAAPSARGLFDRAIAQSAYMITLPELRNSKFSDLPAAEAIGEWLLGQFGAADIQDLRSRSAETISEGAIQAGYFPLPTIDAHTLPDQLVDVFDRGEQAPVPVLAGFNEGEIRSLPILLPPAPANAAKYKEEIAARYGDRADEFLVHYPEDSISESMLATTRDAMYGWAAERLAVKQTALGAEAFLYFFDHGYPAADDGGYHAFHASEIPFVFGTMDLTPPLWPVIPETQQEQRLSDAMLSYWASFVRDGVPRAVGEPDWPPYGESRTYLAFEDRPLVRSEPPNRYELHEAVICRRRAQGGVSWNWNVGVISPPLPPPAPVCR
ncbi:carboxylesterase family protein [uncultured Hyphomonas sp.]|jgi:para-nitrobenzyl esterase|uniref:carboxylesterase/lipase family protein n=1 Tax=uncultured Hyphomonas sp. TaxID=225298 RepID=UPI000C664D05|nr:carboxylesterase [Hyphomonadaceae bacterium]|tara:strand:- start:516 stop:2177 length:1662 start_codon:yes stop_codon:yes gene_type:complete